MMVPKVLNEISAGIKKKVRKMDYSATEGLRVN